MKSFLWVPMAAVIATFFHQSGTKSVRGLSRAATIFTEMVSTAEYFTRRKNTIKMTRQNRVSNINRNRDWRSSHSKTSTAAGHSATTATAIHFQLPIGERKEKEPAASSPPLSITLNQETSTWYTIPTDRLTLLMTSKTLDPSKKARQKHQQLTMYTHSLACRIANGSHTSLKLT